MANVPITTGTGSASVAAETVSGVSYQQIEVYGAGGSSVLAINPDGSAKVSVIGTIGASIIGTVPVTGTFNVSSASVVQQGTWIVSIVSTVPSSVQVGASIIGLTPVTISGTPNVNVAGSVVAFQAGTFNTSIVSTVPSSALVGASIFGQLPAGTAPLGSVAVLQGTLPWAMAGSVAAFQAGTWNTSITSTLPSSVQVGASIIGLPPVNVTNTNLNVGGSVVGFQGGAWSTSIVGAPVVADNSAWAEGNIGVYQVNVRNDTLSSVSAADVRYTPATVGQAGEQIVANSPLIKWISGTADLRGNSGGSVTVIAAQGASIFTYVTGVQVVNMGATSVLVTLSGATSSIVGYTVAPVGGGSNIVYPNALKTNANAAFAASISGISSVLVSAQGFISKT